MLTNASVRLQLWVIENELTLDGLLYVIMEIYEESETSLEHTSKFTVHWCTEIKGVDAQESWKQLGQPSMLKMKMKFKNDAITDMLNVEATGCVCKFVI